MAKPVKFFTDDRELKNKSFLLRLTPSEHEQLQTFSRRENVGISDFIRQAIDRHIQALEKRKPPTRKKKR